MRDDIHRANYPIRRRNHLSTFQYYWEVPFAHPLSSAMDTRIVVPRKWLIIYCPVTSSDMTSPFYRTLEMNQRGWNFMLAKFQDYCFTSWRLSSISFHPNNAPENLKSQKIHKNRGGELRMVLLTIFLKATKNNFRTFITPYNGFMKASYI